MTTGNRRGISILVLITACLVFTFRLHAQSPQTIVDRVLSDASFKNALQSVDADHDRIIRETIAITEVEAPPFKEANRARAYMQMLKDHGLINVEMDAEGNVMGIRKGAGI